MHGYRDDLNRALMLDANAVAGALHQIFGQEVTFSVAACSHCGNTGAVGTLLAFTHAPGVVLRCPACEQVVLRFVTAPDGLYLDARGAAYVRLSSSR